MLAIRTYVRAIVLDDEGATAIEYGLIAALIILAMVGGLTAMGGGAGGMWENIKTQFLAA